MLRKPSNFEESFVGKCKLGWTAFGNDPYLITKPMTISKFIWISDITVDKNIYYNNPNTYPNPHPCNISENDKLCENLCNLDNGDDLKDCINECENLCVDGVYNSVMCGTVSSCVDAR